jgi:hypothetical protein
VRSSCDAFGDELAAGMVELGEPETHPVEALASSADLVPLESVIGSSKRPARSAPPRLQPPQPAREQPRARSTDRQRDHESEPPASSSRSRATRAVASAS